MKASELRAKDVAALKKEVTDLLKAHFGLRMQKATQQLTNTGTLRITRRDICGCSPSSIVPITNQ